MNRTSLSLRPAPIAFHSASRSHAGGRELNEDRVLDRPDIGLWAVADGMGGHRGGAAAASRLVDTLNQANHGLSGHARLADIVGRATLLNAALFRGADAQAVSGTTLVALLAHEGHYACLWAGDSRAYGLKGEVLSPITQDHSLVQSLIDSGELSEGERRGHPQAHVITRAVGAASSLEVEQRFGAMVDADRYILCSDGLSAGLDDGDIARLMRIHDLEDAADALLALALARAPRDNISFVLIDPNL